MTQAVPLTATTAVPRWRGPHPPLDLQRLLLWRVALFAVLLLIAAASLRVVQGRERERLDVAPTGLVVQQLLNQAVARQLGAFERELSGLDLRMLDHLGERVPFCLSMEDLAGRALVQRCEGAMPGALGRWLGPWMALGMSPEAVWRGVVGQEPGIKLGVIEVTPHWALAAESVLASWRNGALLAVALAALSALIVAPVRRVLRPTDDILRALSQMESGDLSVRLPAFELQELRRISEVFNTLAERLQATLVQQRQLAARLLAVREHERRHLARELHDEMGQWLASLQAEAAFVATQAGDDRPALVECAQAMSRTTARMLDVLQRILQRLRPVGLDAFGLQACLHQLVSHWGRAHDEEAMQVHLTIEGGPIDDVPDAMRVHVYRMVQESLTNAHRHGQARTAWVRIVRQSGQVVMDVQDDGRGLPVGSPTPRSTGGGRGLLGLHERVAALGGSLAWQRREPQGSCLQVVLPLSSLNAVNEMLEQEMPE